MARVTLELPERFIFTAELPVYINFINYGGHMGNDAVLTLIHEARVRFLRTYGYTELDIEGRGIVLSDAVIVYKSEGFPGDTLVVEIALTDFVSYGCDICYRLTNKVTGKEVARVKTGIVFFNYQARCPTRIPEGFRQRFANGEDGTAREA